MNIVIPPHNTLPQVLKKRELDTVTVGNSNPQATDKESVAASQQVKKPQQIERLASYQHQAPSGTKKISTPIGLYQNIVGIDDREILESLVGVDFYV